MYRGQKKKIVASIEARMTSSRLPGKVLLPLAGAPALERLIERLQRSQYVDEIVVATTTNVEDDPVVACAKKCGADAFRGSEYDVLSRVLGAVRSCEGDVIVQITGDCPLVDHRLVDECIEAFFSHTVHYATNSVPVSYPVGFDVQVFPTAVLAEVDTLTQDPIDRVHVSYYIYTHPERFRIHVLKAAGEYYWPDLRVTLDERTDYILLDTIFTRLLPMNEDFSCLDVIRLLRNEPALCEINKHVREKPPQEG